MPLAAFAFASWRATFAAPALTAPPTTAPPLGLRPFSPPTITIRPKPRSRMPGQGRPDQADRPEQLYLQRALEVGVRDVVEGAAPRVAGAVDEDVEPPEPSLGLVDDGRRAGRVEEVAGEGGAGDVCGRSVSASAVEPGVIAPDERQAGAFGRERLGDGGPDAARRPDDHDDLVLEL